MTQAQRDATEAIGYVLMAFGVALWLHLPWLLLIIGVLLVGLGNAGKAHNGDSP